MKKAILFLIIFMLPGIIFSQGAPVTAHPEVSSAFKVLELWLDAQLTQLSLPGMTAGIVLDQDLIWSYSTGFRDAEAKIPMRNDSVYRIASISKLFTSIAIMKLYDEGKLRLDDPIKKHLPWLKLQKGEKDSPEVTIRLLLTHTSGIPREAPFPYFSEMEFPSYQEVKESLAQENMAYRPGSTYSYSNLGMALLGMIVSAVSGEQYEDYIRRNILEPLGMKNSGFKMRTEIKSRLAKGYGRLIPDKGRQEFSFIDLKGLNPAGGLFTDLADLSRFVFWQLRLRDRGGHEILKGSTLAEMQRVHWLFEDWSSGQGLGFMVYHTPAGDIVVHGGQLFGFASLVGIHPEGKLGLILLFNANDADTRYFAQQVFAFAGEALGNASVSTPVSPDQIDSSWEHYQGSYTGIWGDLEVLIMNDRLAIVHTGEPNLMNAVDVLLPVSKNTFRLVKDKRSVSFEMNPDGTVKRMRWGASWLYPKEK
jgi:CubicO group peptidase (beta-lactamase class C family)